MDTNREYNSLRNIISHKTQIKSVTVGTKFVAVFPENIAYYHPSAPVNKVRVTAMHGATTITVTYDSNLGIGNIQDTLQSGDIRDIPIDAKSELDKKNSSNVVIITGTNNISVEIVSQKNNSIQSALLLPVDLLGKEYQVPPIPNIQGTTSTASDVNNEVTERTQFKLILVNPFKDENTITVGGSSVTLQENQMVQVWVEQGMIGVNKVVSGTGKFLAVFSHSCAVQFNCTCGLLYTPLQPKATTTLTFMVPPPLYQGASSYLLKTYDGVTEQFTSSSATLFHHQGSVVLQRPGLLLNLIPVEEFGSCFVIYTVADTTNWAVIMAPTNSTQHVKISPTTAVSWTAMAGTNFSHAEVSLSLNSGKHIIYHESALMAVWFLGKKVTGAWFGNPAARLSIYPDYRGCAVVPEELVVLPAEESWQKSIQACKDKGLELISLKNEEFQNHIYDKLQSDKDGLTEVWMGLRKSSYTGRWYWISDEPLEHVDWAHGSPTDDDEGHCARINVTQRAGWTLHECCSLGRPVCYKLPVLLTVGAPAASG
ncbi:hypothetical protein WMY93_026075 [Mugilogobius chulae]|uniref:C-type lectin domain-containing protein n=1 Tax=Mugilogobius chulae TaxID=88201 RepID=A0AAW0MXE9_9GOBI